MKQLFGYYNLADGNYIDYSVDIYRYDSSEYLVCVIGNVLIDGKLNCGEKIIELFCEKGTSITENIGGLYILLIYNKKKKRICVFHDHSTSPHVLYYTIYDNNVFVGTSLKRILSETNMKRTLNEEIVEDFVTNGYLYGKDTLIKNVYKLESHHALCIEKDTINQVHVKYSLRDMTKGDALDSWNRVLDSAIEKSFENEEEINVPLSSGYDSNYIAYVASEKGKVPIHAFSVGGKYGKNEIPVVEDNIQYLKGIDLNTALTDCKTLQNFPDIVWRLEGAVYESGLFLQYELLKLVHKCEKKYLICGECADQVMNTHYLDENKIHPNKKEEEVIYYDFAEYPYIIGNYLILKKNGILANSFEIETRYPYLDDEFVAVAHALRYLNGQDKRCHVANCREQLPRRIVENMSKLGGATEAHSLFDTESERKAFLDRIEESEFFESHKDIIKRHSLEEKEKQAGLQMAKTRLRNIVLDILCIDKEKRRASMYFHDEMKLREYLNYAYLILFEKLFISGKYDEYLSLEGIHFKLDELI